MEFDELERLTPEFNITQLIDVVLLLLFFFMISTSFVTQPGMDIDLPTATTSGEQSQPELRVLMTNGGEIYIQETLVEESELEAGFRSAIEELQSPGADGSSDEAGVSPSEMVLVIKADRRVSHGAVVRVLDTARALGVHQLALATRPEGTEQDQ